ncbi:nuclear transport factor 2 family protein [Actinocorallia longicatena]|uniref:SnoaL-like domain-containing protein n=1 Tax=Actinocorallia longicatena TaxID=111803 RepID=A0ABP6QJI1_9ACTN
MSPESLVADRLEIADLFTRFALLLDERRWDDAGTVFAEDVVVGSPLGGEVRGVADLVEHMRGSEIEGVATQHLTTDLLVGIDGDRASASANSLVYFFRDGRPPHRTSGLRLNCTAVRTPGGWRLGEARITLAWTHET